VGEVIKASHNYKGSCCYSHQRSAPCDQEARTSRQSHRRNHFTCSVFSPRKEVSFLSGETGTSVVAVQAKSPDSNASRRPSIQTGTKISLPGIDWSQSTRTVVLPLSTTSTMPSSLHCVSGRTQTTTASLSIQSCIPCMSLELIPSPWIISIEAHR
jgi:hypothetical protein